MQVAIYSSKPYDREHLESENRSRGHKLVFFDAALNERTALACPEAAAVCAFVNDALSRETLQTLSQRGVRLIALRCAGYNNVDLRAAAEFGITVARVPVYSPHAVAEHAVALLLCLNRKLHKAYARVREGNFSLNGLGGFDLYGRTTGVVGTGAIGLAFARIMRGFGCRVLAFDPAPDPQAEAEGIEYVELTELFSQSHVISLHCPLLPATRHLIDAEAIALMKPGVVLLNTGRGALVDTQALIGGLKSRQIGALGLDVYEEEAGVFFEDHSGEILGDDTLMRLVSFPNVLLTSHQGFLTEEALASIAAVTFDNIDAFESGSDSIFRVTL